VTNPATRISEVQAKIAAAAHEVDRDPDATTLIAVSKTFEAPVIRPFLEAGQIHFGENRVQESQGKWPELKADFPDTVLHLIGPLQSNKAADAVALFDVIHTVDRPKIARALATEMKKQGRRLKLFVQVNVGAEDQKAGVDATDLGALLELCRGECGLGIAGLMCIPPFDDAPAPHLAFLAKLAAEHDVSELSMGMSADFETAVQFGANYVRVGSALFGARG